MSARIGYGTDDERLAVRGRALVLGIVIFLASELMFFAAWFAAYYDLRLWSTQWPPAGVRLDVVEASIGTVVLGLSDLFSIAAIRAIQRDRPGPARAWLWAGVAAALIFLGLTLHGWSKNLWVLQQTAYGGVYFGLLGFHAAHVAAGAIALSVLALAVSKPAFRGAHAAGAEAITYYWHFVFIVWLGIWPTVYFVR